MAKSWTGRIALFVLGSCIALAGCAEERPPINKVQADALAKSFFVGEDLVSIADDPEFYMRPTLVDVGYGASGSGLFTSTYAQPVNRIKWEISETLLVARLTHELIEDADGKGSTETNNGTVVAAFAIKGHFDIRRGYNPSTGEENNVIEENTSDRVWHLREYFRVDWSQNLVTDAYSLDMLGALGVNNGVTFTPLAYHVNDPKSDDHPVFDANTGYFDVTNRLFAAPRILDTPIGTYPACYFRAEVAGGTYPVGSCDPVEVKVRISFKRIVDTDYEPKSWDYTRFSMFGAFYEERRGWVDEYGVVDAKWHRLGSFYNIWEKSHVLGPDGLPIECNVAGTTPVGLDPLRDGDEAAGVPANGTHDECEIQGAPAGSHCDPLSRECTIPYAQRTTRKIPWYFGPDQDEELFEMTALATGEWDMAVREGVQTGRLTECRRTAGLSAGMPDATACDAAFPVDEASVKAAVPTILLLCHNPVAEGDDPACGAVGLKARLGDLRYNFVNALPTPQSGSPWGIMVDGVDPLTGEKVQASINVWDSVTKTAAQTAVDVVRWLNGEIDEEDIKSGAYINSYAISGDLVSKDFQSFRTMTKAEADARVRGLSRLPAEMLTGDPAQAKAMSSYELGKLGAAAFGQTYGDPVDNGPKVNARYQAALDSPLDAELTTANFVQVAGLDPSMPVDEDVLQYASPLRGSNFQRAIDMQRFQDQALAERGVCMIEAPEPQAMVGLAKIMSQKFPIVPEATEQQVYDRVVKMRDYLRKRLYYGVMLHEMGHSIGLRHNFVGSFDSFNFRPQYWQLRTKDGTVTEPCTDQVEDGSVCVGPRWHDPLDQSETDGLLWMWQHTTVMDYPGDVTQDTLGLGPYDKAAARFFYTDTLDVWNGGQTCLEQDSNGNCTDLTSYAIRGKVGNSGGIGGPWTTKSTKFADAIHYSQFQNEFQLIRNCRPSEKTQPANWDEARDGVWSPVLDGQVVNGTECDGAPKDYIGYDDLETYTLEKGARRIRWPHMFATDYSADIGNVAVLRHDNGADIYEQFNYLMTTYENRHVFADFRRGRHAFSVRTAAFSAMSRYHDKMRNIIQGFALYHDWFLRSISLQTKVDYTSLYEGADGMLKPNALAATMAFDHFTRHLTRPQPGAHAKYANDGGDIVLRSTESELVQPNSGINVYLPEGSQRFSNGTESLADDDFGFGGRKVNNSLNNGDGSYDIQWLTGCGSYYEKVYASYHLTESSNRFLDVSLNDFVDGRYRNLSFVNLFPDGFRRLIGTALTGDTEVLGPRVASASGTLPEVTPDKTLKRPIGWVSWWPEEGPQVCWPAHGTLVCQDPVDGNQFDQDAPPNSMPVDPAVGVETQKFIIFNSLLYLPENWKSDWVDQFRIYSIGGDSSPDLPTDGALWFRDPMSGTLYIARRHGTEQLFGKTVEKGISARMLAWANLLVTNAYEVESVDAITGEVKVVMVDGDPKLKGGLTKCEDSIPCTKLRNYKALIDFTRQTAATFGFEAPEPIGINFN